MTIIRFLTFLLVLELSTACGQMIPQTEQALTRLRSNGDLNRPFNAPSGFTLEIKSGATLSVASGGALTLAPGSTLNLFGSAVTNAATFRSAIGVSTGTGDLVSTNNLSDVASASTARTNLGLAIGTNVQAYDADLTDWATVSPSANGKSFVSAANYAAMKALLDLEIGTDVQAFDAQLTSVAGLSFAGNASKVMRVKSDESGFELVSGSGAGDVVGPVIATDNAMVRFDGTTGKLVQNSVATIADTTGNISAGKYNNVTISVTDPTTGAALTFVDGKGLSVSNSLVLTGTDGSSVNFGTGGAVVYQANNLGVLAPTSSSQLKGLLTDELGDSSGKAIFALGTLAIASGKTFTASSSLTLTGTDGTSFSYPGTSGQVATLNATQTFTGQKEFQGPGTPVSVIASEGDESSTLTVSRSFVGLGTSLVGGAVAGVTTLQTSATISFAGDGVLGTALQLNSSGANFVNTDGESAVVVNLRSGTTSSAFRFYEPTAGGTHYVEITTPALGANRAVEWPDAAGTIVLHSATQALTNKTYNGVTLTGSSSPSLAVTGTATISGANTGDQTSVTGNAGTVTVADAGGDTTTWPLLGTSQTGSLSPATDAGITYNSSTNTLTTTAFVGALTGNASTASALQTPREINGVPFDGTTDITIGGGGGSAGMTWTYDAMTMDTGVFVPNNSAPNATTSIDISVEQKNGSGVNFGVLFGALGNFPPPVLLMTPADGKTQSLAIETATNNGTYFTFAVTPATGADATAWDGDYSITFVNAGGATVNGNSPVAGNITIDVDSVQAASSITPAADGTYDIHNDGVTSGQVTSFTIAKGIITAITTIP